MCVQSDSVCVDGKSGKEGCAEETSLLCLFSELCGCLRAWQRCVYVGWERQVE